MPSLQSKMHVFAEYMHFILTQQASALPRKYTRVYAGLVFDPLRTALGSLKEDN